MKTRIFIIILLAAISLFACLPEAKRVVVFPAMPCARNYYEGEEKCTYYYYYHKHYESQGQASFRR